MKQWLFAVPFLFLFLCVNYLQAMDSPINFESDNFGWRYMSYADYTDRNDGTTYYVYHPAADLNAENDNLGQTPIYAIAAGEIVAKNTNWGGIVIRHTVDTKNYYSQYGHMIHLDGENILDVPDEVTEGQLIGYVGDEGSDGVYHLHFEIRSPFHPDPTDADYWGAKGANINSRKEVFTNYESPLAFVRMHQNDNETVIIVDDAVTYPDIGDDIIDNRVESTSGSIIKELFFQGWNLNEWNTYAGSTGENRGFEGNYHYSLTTHGDETTSGKWYFGLPESGTYEVKVSIPANNATSEKATYEIYHNNLYDYVEVDQSAISGDLNERWVSLGAYFFKNGNDHHIKLSNSTGEGGGDVKFIAFDAIKLTISPVGIYDDSSGFHTDGTSQAFIDTYNELKATIGYPADNDDGGVFVHEYKGLADDSFSVWIQDFYNPETEQWYALILNDLEDEPVVNILQGAIRDFYMNEDGPCNYGVPFTSEIAGKLADSHLTESSDLIRPSSESCSGCEPQSIVVQKFKLRKNGTYYNNERRTIVHNPDNGVTGHMPVGAFAVNPSVLLDGQYPTSGDIVTFADPQNPYNRYSWPIEGENIVPTSYDSQNNFVHWFTKAGSYLIFVNDIDGNPIVNGLIHTILEGNLQFVGDTVEFHTLSGLLSDADSNPMYGYIYAYNTSDSNLYNNVSTYDGYYEMALFPGSYMIYPTFYYLNNTSASYTNVSLPMETIDVLSDRTFDIQAEPYTFYHIHGQVVNNNNDGVSGVEINTSGSTSYSSDYTDNDGHYDLMVTQGTYSLNVIPQEGSLLKSEHFTDLQVSSDYPLNIILNTSDDVLSGNFTFNDGNLASGWLSLFSNSNGFYQNYYVNNGQFKIPLDGGDYQVNAQAYMNLNGTYNYIIAPYATVNVSGDTSHDVIFPHDDSHSLTGRVTDLQNNPQADVWVMASNNNYTYYSQNLTDSDGNYQLYLNSGTYRLNIDPPAASYPNFNIEKLIIDGDSERNIRLSLEYKIIEDAMANLSPDLDVALDIFDIINEADALNYNILVQGGKELLEIVLNWGGSELKISLYDPDGNFYGEYQTTEPPLIVNVPNPKEGNWRCEITAIEIPYDNYPFALVSGISPNQSPIANTGGPYNGQVYEPILLDATNSSDPDGDIVSYEWDWQNDGTYDESTFSSTINHEWNSPYSGLISLRVTDTNGATNIATTEVTISESNTDVDSDGILDETDNCLNTPNPDQIDLDNDGIGDVCDSQICGNGIVEEYEECDDGNIEDGDGCSILCSLETILGDFDQNDCVDRADYSIIISAVRSGSDDVSYDLNNDGVVNIADARYLVTLFDNPRGASCF
ncbi:golvesin C-terminal-like domain-containing protein [Desulforhopalus sp. 52FAK]